MYEISFYDRDKLVVKNGTYIWRSLSLGASQTLTSIINNDYLKNNHPQLRKLNYITTVECHVKYHKEKNVVVNGHCYWFNNYFSKRNLKILKRDILADTDIAPEIYIPNILFNGRGIWVVNNMSILKDYQGRSRLFSHNKNIKFGTREFSKTGLLI